jgi:hypothetical protein
VTKSALLGWEQDTGLYVCSAPSLQLYSTLPGRLWADLLEQFDMTSTRYLRGKLADIQSQMGDLRDQVQALTTNRLTPVATDWAGKTGAASRRARSTLVNQTQGFSGQVNERPIVAILIAVTAGWAVGRFGP